MKKSILYIASLVLAAAGLTGCDDDKAIPPVPMPGGDGPHMQANTTILELKQAFNKPSEFSYATQVGTKENGEHYIISGTIISSDKEGNIYKTLMIQDESAGLTIAVDKTKLYQDYKIGQTLAVDVTGLYMGAYGNCMQLGGVPQTGRQQPGRIEEELFTEHSECYGFPTVVEPTVVTVEQIMEYRNNPEEFLKWQSRYVKFLDMEFETPGEPLAVQGQSTSRYAFDAEGGRIQLYNSGQSQIWTSILPWGKGNIVGVLSFYNRDWQLLLNGLDDLQDFTGGNAPVESIFSESFGSGTGSFTIENENIEGMDYVWSFAASYSCMKASAFVGGSNHASSSRLVSPIIDLTDAQNASASYDQACNYFASLEAARAEAAFEVREEGGQWQALEVPNFTDYSSWTFNSSGSIDLSAFHGKKIQVAFHYSSTAAKAGTWEVKNLKIRGTK